MTFIATCGICKYPLPYCVCNAQKTIESVKDLEVQVNNNNEKKYDQGKNLVGLMKSDFSRALKSVSEVTTYGVKKYNQPGSWRLVSNCIDRYEDALGRHDLEMSRNKSSIDKESGLLHAAHRAWNALAVLEKILEGLEQD